MNFTAVIKAELEFVLTSATLFLHTPMTLRTPPCTMLRGMWLGTLVLATPLLCSLLVCKRILRAQGCLPFHS